MSSTWWSTIHKIIVNNHMMTNLKAATQKEGRAASFKQLKPRLTSNCVNAAILWFVWSETSPNTQLLPLSVSSSTSAIGGRASVRNMAFFLSCPWYLWWSVECDGKSPSLPPFSPVIMESRQEAERVAGYSSFHHLPTTHTWLKDLCKLGGLHHLYPTPSEISRAAATVNIDKMLANGGRGNSV